VRLGSVLQFVKEEQDKRPVKRSQKAPKRSGQQQRARELNAAVFNN